MDEHQRAAEQILSNIEKTYVPSHDYVQAGPRDFRHLNLKFYESTLNQLEPKGFIHAGDLEDRTISNSGGLMMRIMIRSLIGGDGTIMCGAYHPMLRLLWRIVFILLRKNPGPVVDFETEYDDGSFVVTSNASFAPMMSEPPMIIAKYLPPSMSASELLALHTTRLAAYEESAPHLSRRRVASIEDVIAAQNRMNALKSAYRNELGGISKEELDRLWPNGPELTRKVHERVVAIRGSGTSA